MPVPFLLYRLGAEKDEKKVYLAIGKVYHSKN